MSDFDFDFGATKEKTGSGVPANFYQAEFVGVERVPAKVWNGKELPPGFRFDFKVIAGVHAGATASRILSGGGPVVDTKNGPNAMAKFLSALTGIPATSGANFNAGVKEAIGRKYTIVVKDGDKGGGTRVDQVSPIG